MASLILYSLLSLVFAETIEVTATRLPTKASPNNVVFTEEKVRQSMSAPELLQKLPGVHYVDNGGQQTTTTLFLRGSEAGDSLVLLDGIELNDASNTTRFFDFSNIDLYNIERVEVLKGPQSGLYGSDAMSGVVNFITNTGEGEKKLYFNSGIGSYRQFIVGATSAGAGDRSWYSLSVQNSSSEGFSSANDPSTQADLDGSQQTVVHAKLGYDIFPNSSLETVLRFQDRKSELDNGGGVGGDDPNFTSETKYYVGKIQHKLTLFRDSFEATQTIQANRWRRKTRNPSDLLDTSDTQTSFLGRTEKIISLNKLFFDDQNMVAIGYEHEKESIDSESVSNSIAVSQLSDRSVHSNSVFLVTQNTLGWFTLNNSVRADIPSTTDTVYTFRTNPIFNIAKYDIRILGSYGRGIKSPSLFQLFSSFGNANLKQERLLGFDLSVEKKWLGGMASITYFNYDVTNQIDFDLANNTYFNTAESNRSGVEFNATQKWHRLFSSQLGYTYLDAISLPTRLVLLRRPTHTANATLEMHPHTWANSQFHLQYTGKRDDLEAETLLRVRQPAYWLLNWSTKFTFQNKHEFRFHLKNILNRDYEAVNGFQSAGRNYLLQYRVQI